MVKPFETADMEKTYQVLKTLHIKERKPHMLLKTLYKTTKDTVIKYKWCFIGGSDTSMTSFTGVVTRTFVHLRQKESNVILLRETYIYVTCIIYIILHYITYFR